MAENEQPKQQFAVQRIYVKDLSFETPNTPEIFTKKWEPQVNVDLNTQARDISEGVYEVLINITVTTKIEDQTAYLAEVQQAGIFTVTGFPEDQLGPMLHSFCPSILFPYAREVVSSLANKGSFPQLLLAPVNFDALYAEQIKKQQDTDGEGTASH
ncbi:protein-export chaperone SecB [Thiohalomonas denitrificans]|uniref:Protein-export protein SecB n=1 Tax=Thiohalomonas denitrificans TaxID=415747 RepID=A0A1G5QV15_9GAMM|nr:protein-export chaperone SecB [Thiohalomonas denitrificans]SCZ65101.1 preprotein translocase subunit SecB [Thiohalomonas denitrificans]